MYNENLHRALKKHMSKKEHRLKIGSKKYIENPTNTKGHQHILDSFYLLEDFDTVGRLQYMGTDFGGYPILNNHLDSESICYCAGAARDISFEIELHQEHGCKIFIFDPSPEYDKICEKIITSKGFESHVKFFSYGFEGFDGELEFFPDFREGENPRIGQSWSGYQRDKTQTSPGLKVPVKKISTIMKDNNHTKLDLLKMDIEGSEYAVIDDIIDNNLDIDVIDLEFHGEWSTVGDTQWGDDVGNNSIGTIDDYKKYQQKLYDFGYRKVWQLGYRDTMYIKKDLL